MGEVSYFYKGLQALPNFVDKTSAILQCDYTTLTCLVHFPQIELILDVLHCPRKPRQVGVAELCFDNTDVFADKRCLFIRTLIKVANLNHAWNTYSWDDSLSTFNLLLLTSGSSANLYRVLNILLQQERSH
jgi:hypothetical protein